MKKPRQTDLIVAIKNAQLLAIEGRLSNTIDAFERRVRRWFSKEHSTPYLDTFKIPWDELLLHYYESSLSTRTYNQIFDLAVEEYLPEFIEQAEKEAQDFADSLLKQQEAAIRANQVKKAPDSPAKEKTQGKALRRSKTDAESQSLEVQDNNPKTDQPAPKTMSLRFEDESPEDL